MATILSTFLVLCYYVGKNHNLFVIVAEKPFLKNQFLDGLALKHWWLLHQEIGLLHQKILSMVNSTPFPSDLFNTEKHWEEEKFIVILILFHISVFILTV